MILLLVVYYELVDCAVDLCVAELDLLWVLNYVGRIGYVLGGYFWFC